MFDDDARRALEEEAIALVSLSHSHPPKKARRAPPASREAVGAVTSTNKRAVDDRFVPSRGVFSTANFQLPVHVIETPTVGISGDQRLVREAENEPRFLSVSVFVNGDGDVNEMPHKSGVAEIRNAAVMERSASSSPTPTTSDPQISMQSLLVTLKKRKADSPPPSSQGTTTTKLPRFRDVFEPPRVLNGFQQRPHLPPPIVAPLKSATPVSPIEQEIQEHPAPPELKCKYRTGKCTNTRALKSCGDYHNLCNYHRLRANANQRKLDRKKKVQRVPSSGETGMDAPLVGAPTVAAAAALASLPASYAAPPPEYSPYFAPEASSTCEL